MNPKKIIHIAILSAMVEEVGEFVTKFNLKIKFKFGDLIIYGGRWNNTLGIDVFLSVAWSGWGKVSAARAVTRLISANEADYGKIDLILFTGVAGAVDVNLKQWDIVIANALIQHDMNAAPLFDKFVIPSLKKSYLEPELFFSNSLFRHLNYLSQRGKLNNFGTVNLGLIATGDEFISNKLKLEKLRSEISNLCAVEMEGAAVAQVAEQENIKYLVMRVISDNADDSAADKLR